MIIQTSPGTFFLLEADLTILSQTRIYLKDPRALLFRISVSGMPLWEPSQIFAGFQRDFLQF